MTRLLIHVEGQTEETFVNEVLAPYLYASGYELVSARLFGNARQRFRRGGVKPWHAVRNDIKRHLSGDRNCTATLMVDYYGMPRSGDGEWPGRIDSEAVPFINKADVVEKCLLDDLSSAMHPDFDRDRFVPFVLMHEFEALLFSDCAAFARSIGRLDVAANLQTIRNGFQSPEEINDSPLTAPSKRVMKLVAEYQKPLHGNIAALEVGIAAMRAECSFFCRWVDRLEALV